MKKAAAFPWRVLLTVLMAALMIGVCSKSSPLYPMNDWVDVHCFFTVGRGIRHGLVPYLDLYEQKGPLLYLLYALAALISEHSFLGVYLIETLCFAAFLHYSGKTAETLSGQPWAYPLTAALMGVTVPLTPAFSHGGSAEELILPVLAAGLYTVVRAMHDGRKISGGGGIALGILTAVAFWTKYTFCGLFAGLALGTVVYYLSRRWFRELAALIGRFMLGLLTLSALIVVWLAAKGALPAMWNAYLINNLTMYSQNIRGGHYDPPLLNLLNNLPWAVPAVLGLVLAFFRKGRLPLAVTLCLAAVGLFSFTYLSGRRYPYYALVLSVFASIGYGQVFAWCRGRSAGWSSAAGRVAALLTALLIVAGPLAAYRLSSNAYLIGTPREEMPQYRFAARIHETEDQTLLNQGFLDGGFYYAAGVLPSSPYFCTLNIDLPEMSEAISRSVREGETAYVITRQQKLRDDSKYQLIDQCTFPFEGRDWTYYLYRRRGM